MSFHADMKVKYSELVTLFNENAPLLTRCKNLSEKVPPFFIFSGILHPSFELKMTPLPRENWNAHAAPLGI